MSKAHLNSSKSGTIERLCQAVYPSFAMLAGMKLDLFTPLAESAMSADELAAALGVDPARLGAAALCARQRRTASGGGRAILEQR